MSLDAIYAPVRDDFERVNAQIHDQLNSRVPLVEHIGHYIVDSGGKRLRPLLVLLSAGALGHSGEREATLAAVIEFLHTATLLHDDVVDTSELRRGRETANAKWGNAPSVLVGDFLYARSFQMMVDLGNLRVMGLLSEATGVIAEGEVLQLTNVRNPDLSETDYRNVIHSKTAMLFQAAAHSAAVLAETDTDTETALRDFGQHLGMAFQIVDDVLDYEGSAETMGKNVGDDLAEGKTTLPLIHAMSAGSREDASTVRQAIRSGGPDHLGPVLEAVHNSGAIAYCRQRAEAEADRARQCLNSLSDSAHRQALHHLVDLAVQRSD